MDEKLIEMQERKRKQISEAIEFDQNKMLRKMNVKELMELFGPVDTHDDGFIYVNVKGGFDSKSDSETHADKSSQGKSGQAAKNSNGGEGAKANMDSTGARKGQGSKARKSSKKNNDSLLAEVTRSDEVEDSLDEGI